MARKNDILSIYTKEVEDIKAAGLFKGEVPIVSAQSAKVKLEDGRNRYQYVRKQLPGSWRQPETD